MTIHRKSRNKPRDFRPRLELLEHRFAPAVLSGNLSAVTSDVEAASGDRWLTSSFGTDANDYELTSVDLLISNPVSGTATVSIYSDGGLMPGSLVGTLASPGSFSSTLAVTTFAASGISLDASSTYWVVLAANSGEFDWAWTSDNTGSGAGFQHTFGDSTDAGGVWFTFDIFPAQMRVNAEVPGSAGITVSPTSGLTTTEAGGTDSFTVVLDSQPTADVTIAISSNDTTEGTVSASSLVFTSANWDTAQTVTVTGVNDSVDDGNIGYSIVTGAAVSSDSDYSGLNAADVSVTNTDNDTAGITVNPTSGLTTTEAGGTASFTVVLNSEPTANVTIAISSNDITEGTVSSSSLTFTAANWNSAQTVTATGVNDFVDDGGIGYSVVTGAASSSDAVYSGLNAADVSLTNTDDDTAGITVSPTAFLITSEAGATANFTVVLTSQPTANVTIAISSNDTTEGTVSASSLTFTAANWNSAQTVTVTGVDDFVDDGDIGYSIVTGAASSSDSSYSALNAADVSITNTNNDTAGITVSPTAGLVTSESGGAASFTIVLNSQPTANVSIAISSSETTEGTVSASSLTFSAANWNAAQTVTVTGVGDFMDDGDIGFSIVTGPAVSSDTNYNGRNAADVSVTNSDDDTAGITVSPVSGLVTTEAGGTASFTVVLNSEPAANVTVAVSSSDVTEGTVSVGSLTFTSANWDAAQTVTVTGVDDFVDDGNIAYTIVTAAATSSDSSYSGTNASDVSVTNTDDDTAGITVNPTSGLITTEAGGTASVTVVLNSEPTADVSIAISSSDTTEGAISASSLTFTAANWNVAQTVTATGVDDLLDDGDIALSIVTDAAVSADSNYGGLDAADVAVSNSDDDAAGITVSPLIGLATTEAGGSASFTVVLNLQPAADVTIAISSNDSTEGNVSASSLTFTAADWNVPQTVTLTGVDDFVDDGNVAYTIVTGPVVSSDLSYSGLNGADVSVTNTDDDMAGITVSPTSGLITTEAGGTASFTVMLDSQPIANVSVAISSNDTTEGSASVSSLTFTAANWNVPQAVTVTGVNDLVDDGDVGFSIVTGAAISLDFGYSGLNAADVSATNTDDDTAGITVSPTSGLTTTEAGGTASFTVVLDSQPTADVTIAISSNDATEGTVSASSLTFTAANWNVAQTVTVTGVNDSADDGDIAYSIVTGAAVSVDANYSDLAAGDVSATNTDDEVFLPTVISNIRLAATGSDLTVFLTFSQPLDAATAGAAGNYEIRGPGRDKQLGTADNAIMTPAKASYDAALRRVTLTTDGGFAINRSYRLFVGDAVLDSNGNPIDGDSDATFGGEFVALIGLGRKFTYVDSNGDLVSLKTKKATMQLVRDATGEGLSLTLGDVRKQASLTDSVIRSAGGDGLTRFDTVRGTAGVSLTRFTQPPFVVANPIAAQVVDRVLDSTESALDLLADAIAL